MDSDRPRLKQRGKNRRKTSSDPKLDTYGLHFKIPTIKLDDSYSISNSGSKKFASPVDSDFKHWALITEGFPPGTTVDELKKYSRRKYFSQSIPQDNLRLEEGSLRPYKSEYTRRYQAQVPTTDLKPLPNDTETNKENFFREESGYPVPERNLFDTRHGQKRLVLKRPPNHLEPIKGRPMEFTTEKNSQYVFYPNSEKRKLLRRSTTLKTEGEMTSETEVRKEYVAYPNPERAQMIRRLPSLKMEGKFESMITEQQDKFIAFLFSKRPIMEKKKTILKMEGDFDFSTENNFSYVPHEPPERPRIRKRSTSLKLDGELEFCPEYRESFVDYTRTRPVVYRPYGTLRSDEGELEKQTETKAQFVNFDSVPASGNAKPENNLRVEGDMEIAPEYKVNYVDFPRERPLVRRPFNQIKPEGNMQVLSDNFEIPPELSSSSSVEKSQTSDQTKIFPTGLETFNFVSEQSDRFKKHENAEKANLIKTDSNLKLEGTMNFVTEKADKFRFLEGDGEKEEAERRPLSLKQENEFLIRPEYKKPYETFKTPLKPVRTFRSNPTSPRKTSKDRIKFDFEDNKKFILGTPSRKSSFSIKPIEKTLKFDLPEKNYSELKDRRQELHIGAFHDKIKASETPNYDSYARRAGGVFGPIQPQFQAFEVLDVKGRLGCQSMRKDPVEWDRSASEDEYSTYRLEVSNPERPRFPGRDWKVFPPINLNEETREMVERRARRRAGETYEKVVKSPEIPNYLLEENNNVAEKCPRKTSGKLSPQYLPNDNGNKVSFTVLGGSRGANQESQKEHSKGDKCDLEMPCWMNMDPIT